MLKEWAAITNEIIYDSQCDKILIRKGVRLHSECWNQRCIVFHDPDAQK